jgi:uncharacterized protein (DUF2249 family)
LLDIAANRSGENVIVVDDTDPAGITKKLALKIPQYFSNSDKEKAIAWLYDAQELG